MLLGDCDGELSTVHLRLHLPWDQLVDEASGGLLELELPPTQGSGHHGEASSEAERRFRFPGPVARY
jgi:hypothetical protein